TGMQVNLWQQFVLDPPHDAAARSLPAHVNLAKRACSVCLDQCTQTYCAHLIAAQLYARSEGHAALATDEVLYAAHTLWNSGYGECALGVRARRTAVAPQRQAQQASGASEEAIGMSDRLRLLQYYLVSNVDKLQSGEHGWPGRRDAVRVTELADALLRALHATAVPSQASKRDTGRPARSLV